MPEEAKSAAIQDINNAIENGELQHRVTHIYPLNEVIKGHQSIEAGRVCGCVLLNVD
jgi:NADPH2:quinone reductase